MRTTAVLALSLLAILTSTSKLNAATEEQRCLAMNIFAESRNTTTADETAVGFVTINRVKHREYPKTVCKVVYQKNQFSWTSHIHKINDEKAYRDADNIAGLILDEQIPDVSLGATSFHEKHINPKWAKKMDVTLRTAVHVYLKKKEAADS
jgi:N-acetylmuramoyl-L-alanine amidase